MSDVMDGQPGDVVLRLAGISKSFGSLKANDGISFELKRGEVLALLGENGAGKTTLMNILFGHYVADAGEIIAFGRALPPGSPRAALEAGIGMVHQHFTLADNLSVLDNIVLGTESLWSWRSQGGAARQRVAQLAADFGLGVNPDARIADLSVGERQRVEILKALYRNARILILDEPTAVLTPQESEGLFATLEKLVARGLAIIFISHKLHEVLAVSERVLVLRQGRLVGGRETKGATRQDLAELMVGRPIPLPKVEPQAAGTELVRLAQVTIAGSHGRNELQSVDLSLREGEILGIAGVSGNGQATLADLLSGLAAASAGTVTLLGDTIGEADAAAMVRRGVGRIPEDRHAVGLIGDMSITENMIAERYREQPFSRHHLIDWQAARNFSQGIIAGFDVRCPGPHATARLLSGGNMQKLILGREMAGNPKLILAAQPTRGLDIGAVGYVHEQLLAARKRGAGILLISEDLDELLTLSDRIAVIYRGQLSAPMIRADFSVQQIGLMMAGHGFAQHEAGHAA
ncbi:ABC transporter ATP-binding protein [Dongia mobilis]|uniref:ABC transporter ATP-binding protein n=1 Tax=Dongia sp. TaxID=1977262 RepID=UPI0026EA0E22